MKLPAYPKYKASGVEWLGNVPEHWEVWKHAHLFQSSMGQTILREQVSESGLLPVLSATEEYEVFGYLDDADVILNPGDLVIPARGNSIGHVKLVRERCTTTQTTISSKPLTSKVSSKFSLYFLLGNRKTLFHFDRTAIPQLTVGQVSSNPILLPPFSEQLTIAKFLDRETGRMDRLVAKKRELIERLKEKRTALISRTVTQGLPPAAARAAGLPENPPLKPSGLNWLSDIPVHWEVVPLGYLVHLSGGATPDKSKAEYWDGSIPWVSPKDMKVARIGDAEDHISPEALENSALRMIPVNSVLIVVRGMILAHSFPIALTTEPVTINQDMKAVVCRKRLTPNFLTWSFAGFAKTFVSFASESAHGTRKLETETLTRFPFLLPPLPEQTAIAAYLDAETAKLDALVAKVETAIERLQEYRTALITAAVTGKIDVRNSVASAEANQVCSELR